MSYKTVIVGRDGSDTALKAVDRAAEIAVSNDSLLVVVCADSPVTARAHAVISRQMGDPAVDQVRGTEAAREALEAAMEHAERAGARGVTTVLTEADAAQALLNAAEEHNADLIVLGNRGINTLSGRLLGSVPVDVTHRSPCDVLIVHTTEGGRD